MASVKVKFRPSAAESKEGSIYYQVIHNRMVRQIRTDYHLFENEWDIKSSTVRIAEWSGSTRKEYIQKVRERIGWDIKSLKYIIAAFDKENKNYTADEIVERFSVQRNERTLFNFTQGVIGQLKRLDKIRTSEIYTATLDSFMKFRKGQDILLCEMNGDIMMLYEAWLKGKGICPNTTSFYMRVLRAVYNRAVEKGLTEQRYPFKHVYTGIDKTVKRAVPMKSIRCIKELDLTLKPHLDYARDMFLFSFYTRGMSFIDMAYLRKSDLKNGILTYRRRKTNQLLTIKWEKCMEEIVSKYASRSSAQYLLPIITSSCTNGRTQYRNALCRVNVALKEIARMIGLPMPLTMYCARHGWASIAKDKNIPLAVISEGMGHGSEETTRIYLASLDTSVVDKANSLILKDL